MKKIYLFALLPSLLLSCKKSEKETLVIYSPHGKELLGDFEKRYEKLHPNVDIQWLDMGSQEVYDRISNEAGNSHADIWWGAPSTMFMRAEQFGYLEQYRPTWADKVPASAKSKKDYWYGTFSTPEVIGFNETKLTAAQAPQDWQDIVSPAWKGKVVLRNPMAAGTLRAIFCAILQQSVAKTGKENDGWKWLKALDANVNEYAADPTQMYSKLSSDQPVVTIWNMPDAVLQKTKNNVPFGYLFPSSGTVVLTDGIAIIQGTKHAKLAKDFYEFVTAPESLEIQAKNYSRIPSRTDIPKDKLPQWMASLSYKAMDVDWNMVAENESEWMQKWDMEIKTKD